MLVIRSGKPGLRVLAYGREVARTSSNGATHALVRMPPPHTTFRVELDTRHMRHLRQQNPATTRTIADADEFFVIDQRFEIERPRRRHIERRGRRPKEQQSAPKSTGRSL